MTSQYRHRRTSVAATPFPANIEPGEIAVNTANRQLALGDADAATLGVPLPLLAIRYFDARAAYVANDYVIQAGIVYRANGPVAPGAFNASNWTVMAAAAGTFVVRAGDTMTGFLTLHADPDAAMKAAPKQYVDTRVIRAGDTMTGDLVITRDNPNLVLDDNVVGGNRGGAVAYKQGGLYRFSTFTSGVESINNEGSNFVIGRYSDAGAFIDLPFAIQRTDGRAYVLLDPVLPLGVATKQYVDTKGVIVTSTTPPATPPDNTLWWDSDNGMLYVRYNDGNTTQWVSAVPLPDTSVYALKTASDAQAQALAANGMQINGGFEVNQEGVASRTSSNYLCDGWYFLNSTTAAITAGLGTLLVPGFHEFAYLSTTGSVGTPSASAISTLIHNIEGYRVSRLAWGTASAQPITIAFWCQHWRAGTYTVSVQNYNASRTYAAAYTQNVSNANEYKTITIPGDTAGTWYTGNATGITLRFVQAAGTTHTAPAANTWYGANYSAAPGQVNGIASASDALRITGVVVLPGTHTIIAEQSSLLMRPYGQELVTCQRYYQKFLSFFFDSGYSSAGFGFAESLALPVLMRSAPTVTFANTTYNNSNTVNTTTPNATRITVGAVCGTAGFTSCTTDVIADARL